VSGSRSSLSALNVLCRCRWPSLSILYFGILPQNCLGLLWITYFSEAVIQGLQSFLHWKEILIPGLVLGWINRLNHPFCRLWGKKVFYFSSFSASSHHHCKKPAGSTGQWCLVGAWVTDLFIISWVKEGRALFVRKAWVCLLTRATSSSNSAKMVVRKGKGRHLMDILKAFQKTWKCPLATYLWIYTTGDTVNMKGAAQKQMPHKYHQGTSGRSVLLTLL
jgi:hypothetical protein